MSDCIRDDITECDCPRCAGNAAAWERVQGWDDDGEDDYDGPDDGVDYEDRDGPSCPTCGEPDVVGCDPGCPALAELCMANAEMEERDRDTAALALAARAIEVAAGLAEDALEYGDSRPVVEQLRAELAALRAQ